MNRYKFVLKIIKYKDITGEDWFLFSEAFEDGNIECYNHLIKLIHEEKTEKVMIPNFVFRPAMAKGQFDLLLRMKKAFPLIHVDSYHVMEDIIRSGLTDKFRELGFFNSYSEKILEKLYDLTIFYNN